LSAEREPLRAFPGGREPHDASTASRFLVLEGLQLERREREVHCRVQLGRANRTFHGEAREMDTQSGHARAAARATLAAAEQAVPGISLGLEGVTVTNLFSRTYIVVSVEAAHDRQFALLAGLINLDPNRPIEDAAVLATLRAIDRWLAS
jgi:hypothetical protein